MSELKIKSPRNNRLIEPDDDIPRKQIPRRKSEETKSALQTKRDKKCNDDLQTLIKVLLVFLIFDFATREFLFQLSLPHLKMIEQNR